MKNQLKVLGGGEIFCLENKEGKQGENSPKFLNNQVLVQETKALKLNLGILEYTKVR